MTGLNEFSVKTKMVSQFSKMCTKSTGGGNMSILNPMDAHGYTKYT